MNPFRPYVVKEEWMNELGALSSNTYTINLFDVRSYGECDNEREGFKDKVFRTCVYLVDRVAYLRVPYSVFNSKMMNFYREMRLLDDRSINEPMPDRIKYKGMIRADFNTTTEYVSCVFFREGYEFTDWDDAVLNCLFKNVTPLN
jgi:hypothetical protein